MRQSGLSESTFVLGERIRQGTGGSKSVIQTTLNLRGCFWIAFAAIDFPLKQTNFGPRHRARPSDCSLSHAKRPTKFTHTPTFVRDSNSKTRSESYGWWPACPLDSLFQCFKGVEGRLNNGLFRCTPHRDPHHAEHSDEEFSPIVPPQDNRTENEIADCLREFAIDYKGKWQWFLGWGRNCHNFQRAALQHCRLEVPGDIRRIKL